MRKFNFKKFSFKILTIFIISFCLFVGLCNSTSVYAAWNNNATDFINDPMLGERSAEYRSGKFWFAQRGMKATFPTTYRILGWRITVKVNNSSKVVWAKNGSSCSVVDEREYKSGSTSYIDTLWSIDYNTIYNKLVSMYGASSITEFLDPTKTTTFIFDAVSTIAYSGVSQGSMDDNGKLNGKTYLNASSLKDSAPWDSTTKSGMDALYNINRDILGSQKPQPTVHTSAARFESYEYKDPSQELYWVQPNNQFRVVVEGYIPARFNVYPTKMLANLQKTSNSRRSNIHLGADNTYSTSEYFYNYFKELTGQTTSKTSSASSKYLTSAIYLKALNHGDEFHLRYRAYYDNTASGTDFTNSNKYLKVDGVAPYLNSNYLDESTQINTDIRYMSIRQQGVSDADSGVNVNGQYAYIYPKGSNHKGNKIPLVQHSVHKSDYVKDNFLL